MSTNNGRINNAQRKVFANLATQLLDQKIQEARSESGELVADITEQVKRELGVDTLENQIQALENQIRALREQREVLGFLSWREIRQGSQAKKLIDSRTSAASEKIRALEEKKTEVQAQIWASTTLEAAMRLLSEVREM